MHKYRVAPKEERTLNGRTYPSKAEMQYAQTLHILRNSEAITEFIEQPKFHLGCPENVYVADFLILNGAAYVVDVKGVETAKFKRDKKLWARYGRLPLHIVKVIKGKPKTIEVITPPANARRLTA